MTHDARKADRVSDTPIACGSHLLPDARTSAIVGASLQEREHATRDSHGRVRPLHICHVFPYEWHQSGGPTNGLRGHIKSQVAVGISVEALSPGSEPEKPNGRAAEDLGCKVTYVDFDRDDLGEIVSGIRRQHDGDVLFQVNSVSDPALRITRALRARNIAYVHTSIGDLHFRSSANFVKKFAFVNFLSRSVRGAAGVHVLTQYEADRLKYLLPFWRGLTAVAPYVVEAPAAKPAPLERRAIGIPDDGFLFLFLGRMDIRQKGLDVLLRAFSMLPPESSRLALVGPDRVGSRVGDAQQLRELARDLGCEDRVHFVPPQEGERKWPVLRLADAFVHPSRWDGFAASVAEAVACGIPTLISRQMNIAPDLAHGSAALTVDLDPTSLHKGMRSLLEAPEDREALGKRGEVWASEHCSIASVGARFDEFYSAITDRSGHQAAPGGLHV